MLDRELQTDIPRFSVWRVDPNSSSAQGVLDAYGHTVLVRCTEDIRVEFYPDGGRKVPQVITVMDFLTWFVPCHYEKEECSRCYSRPGILKHPMRATAGSPKDAHDVLRLAMERL